MIRCLAFNRPRREGWSHCGQTFSKHLCRWLSEAVVPIQVRSTMWCYWSSLRSATSLSPRNSALHYVFSRYLPSLCITCPKQVILLSVFFSADFSRFRSTPHRPSHSFFRRSMEFGGLVSDFCFECIYSVLFPSLHVSVTDGEIIYGAGRTPPADDRSWQFVPYSVHAGVIMLIFTVYSA